MPDEALGQACAVILRYVAKQIASELAMQAVGVQPPATANPAPQALRMAEAGKLLGISEAEVQRLVLRGMLKSFKLGRLRLIPPSAIQTFVETRMAENACVTDTQPELRHR